MSAPSLSGHSYTYSTLAHTPVLLECISLEPNSSVSVSGLLEYRRKTGFKETVKLNGTRNGIGFSLLKGSDDDVAKAIMKDNSIKQSCTTNLLAELKDQCNELCRLSNPSILRSKKVQDIINFKFVDFVKK